MISFYKNIMNFLLNKLFIALVFTLISITGYTNIIYLKSYGKIYYFDVNVCTVIDSVEVNDLNFSTIGLNKDGNIYGCSINQYTIKVDSIFMLNTATKTITSVCTNLPDFGYMANVGACFDTQDNIIFMDVVSSTNTTHVFKYNIHTCSIAADYDLDTLIGVDGDLEYVNDMLYMTSNCKIWQINLNGNSKPVQVFNSTYPCDYSQYLGYYALSYTCFQNKPTFIVSNYENPDNKLYRYDPYTGERVLLCTVNFYVYDAANYVSDVNFFYLGEDTVLCSGQNHTITTNIATTQWSTGEVGPNITITQPGKYWATVNNICGTFSDTIVFKPSSNLSQTLNIGSDTTVCIGSRITIVSNLANTIWSNGVMGRQITILADKDTMVIAKIPYSSCNRIDTMFDTLKIKVDKDISLQITTSTNIFCSTPVVLTSNFPNSIWNNGVIGNQITVNTGGKYWAMYRNACGIYRDTVFIQSISPQHLFIGNDTFICPNSSIIIRSNIMNTTWWDGTVSSQISVNTGGIYWATYQDSCNTYTDSIRINNDLPLAPIFIGNDTAVCRGSLITTYSNHNNTIWHDRSIGDSITFIVNNTIKVIGKKEDKCVSGGYSTDERIISVINDENFQINADKKTICKNDSILLYTDVLNTTWKLPNNNQNTGQAIYASSPGKYIALSLGKCNLLYDSINIVQYCVEECNALVPTAFSPNNDGINDFFFPFINCDSITNYHFEVFNRWGELVFETLNKEVLWDGYYKGVKCQTDDYVWILNYQTQSLHKINGVVHLLN